jgi:hypothetical protein
MELLFQHFPSIQFRRSAVQVGQLFNLFERDLDSMEEDLGTSGSDRGNAQEDFLRGYHQWNVGFYGDVTIKRDILGISKPIINLL